MNSKLPLVATLVMLNSIFLLHASDLVVSAQIDGHSRLVISSGDSAAARSEIVWDHLYAARPGSLGGNYPTTVNGYEWFPVWPATPNGTPGLSGPLTNVAVRFSTNGVSLTQQSGRTAVNIIQQPNATNGFTLVVDFDDVAPAGFDQYTITLQGVSFELFPQLSIYLSAINVEWQTETNRTYQLQYSSPVMPGWINLGPPVPGTGTNAIFTDTIVWQSHRFYRVLLQ